MKKGILEIYGLAICFVAIIFLIFHMSEGIYHGIGILKPELTLPSYTYELHQSNARYKQSWKNKEDIPSEEEVTRLRKESYEIVIRSESRTRFQQLVKNFIYIVLAGVVLLIHWKLSKRARQTAS